MAPELKVAGLYTHIIRRIGDRLPHVMLDGMTNAELRSLALRPATQVCAKQGIRLDYRVCQRHLDASAYWRTIQQHTAEHGPGSLILGFGGNWNHWTCVRRITDKTMLLADSLSVHRVSRRHVSLDQTGRYRLRPKDTFLLSVSEY